MTSFLDTEPHVTADPHATPTLTVTESWLVPLAQDVWDKQRVGVYRP